jgi:hypothetical protein
VQIAVDQAVHLLRLTNLHPRIELRILTFDADIRFVDTDFEIGRFDDERPEFGYIEHPGGSRGFRGRELRQFHEHWQELYQAALDRDESRAFLDRLVNRSR